ncbi:anti-sigma factor [Kangiella sp. TOML190]|uniref:anti-sigma factor family protein n=1 Tax=Kangiella sp. TOML190 TaxID=2931351 RepID=UPI00203F7966|nr:zf-HC2 domain-containing protein [Kangiella sp. TOML190]
MLNCKKHIENSSDYLEGEMNAWQRFNFKMHTLICVRCKRYLKQLQQTIAMIGLAPKQQPPAELTQALEKEYAEAMKSSD